MFPHCNIKEDEVHKFMDSVTTDYVRQVLDSETIGMSGFIALLSPAARTVISEIREKARSVKLRYFGHTVRMYAPLYISNFCMNDCAYCGFKSSVSFERRRLSEDEIYQEADIIKSYGMDSLLLVSGEDPKHMSPDFFAKISRELKKKFSYIGIEIYPMKSESYRKLFEAGIHGLTMFQETYDSDLYPKLHPRGPKSDYLNRVNTPEEAAKAGMYNIGLGVLLGLYDWRIESVSMAAHALYLRKHYWRSKVQFSFPRITPAPGAFQIPYPVYEEDLEQMLLAFRLFFPETDLFLSTRENTEFRIRLCQTAATHMSAASQVAPGGYLAHEKNQADCAYGGQFTVKDPNSVEYVVKELEKAGLEAVFKDWDPTLGVTA